MSVLTEPAAEFGGARWRRVMWAQAVHAQPQSLYSTLPLRRCRVQVGWAVSDDMRSLAHDAYNLSFLLGGRGVDIARAQ